jgi:hypothetical protein
MYLSINFKNKKKNQNWYSKPYSKTKILIIIYLISKKMKNFKNKENSNIYWVFEFEFWVYTQNLSVSKDIGTI